MVITVMSTDRVCVRANKLADFFDLCGGLLFNFEKEFHWNYIDGVGTYDFAVLKLTSAT